MSSHSGDYTLAYALQFVNLFDEANKGAMNGDMVIKDARTAFFKIYKTSDDNPDKQIIPTITENSFAWLKDNMPAEEKEQKIKRIEFNTAVLSSVLYSLKYELGLTYTLTESRDRDEVFCKIFASDEWMLRNAKANEYELQLRHEEKHNLNFQIVPPYAPADIIDYKDKRGELTHMSLFKRYDRNSKEVDQNDDCLFTSTDRRRLVMKVLMQRIDLHQLKSSGVMIEDFCVHEKFYLDDLKLKWANLRALFRPQPLDEIRLYFAEKIAMYFAWIDVYWKFMMVAAGVSLMVFVAFEIMKRTLDDYQKSPYMIGSQMFYAVFLALWATSFQQIWIREENRLAWRWGTTNLEIVEDQRPEFKGIYGKDELTGKLKVNQDPAENRLFKQIVSYLVISLFMATVVIAVVFIFYLRQVLTLSGKTTLAKTVPAFLNALQIRTLNLIYGKIVGPLNDWENYETENQQYDNLAFKNFIFKIVNSYTALIYMAFFKVYFEAQDLCQNKELTLETCPADLIYTKPGCKNCMYDLGFQLSIIFITNMCMNVMEIGLPWLKWRVKIAKEDNKVLKRNSLAESKGLRMDLYEGESDSKLDAYETPADDYMEMIIQFGYVALFGVSSPIIAVLALIEITLEIRVDAWKICTLFKRPDPHRSNSLGIWKTIIVYVGYLGAFTNAAIIVFVSKLFAEESLGYKLLYFLLIEHAMLLVIYLVTIYVNDVPTVVTKGLTWSKRKVEAKYLSWKIKDDVTSKFQAGENGEGFFVGQKDFHYQEN